MDDYRWIYIDFVERIATFATEIIKQKGTLSPQTLSEEISRIVAEQPEISVALWARGLAVRDGLDIFDGAPIEDVEAAYNLAMVHNTDKNTSIAIAGLRATCEGFRNLQVCASREAAAQSSSS